MCSNIGVKGGLYGTSNLISKSGKSYRYPRLSSWGSNTDGSSYIFTDPKDLALDKWGNLYVADGNKITRINSYGVGRRGRPLCGGNDVRQQDKENYPLGIIRSGSGRGDEKTFIISGLRLVQPCPFGRKKCTIVRVNTSHRTAYLENEKIFPLLIKMGTPAAVGMLVNALYNIVDTIFVGHGVGPLAIAALSIVFPIQMIVSSVAQATGVGTASIVSRRLGEKRHGEAARAVGTAYATVILVNTILVGLLFAFMRPILSFFGASEEIMPLAMEYLGIVGAGFFFFALSMCASTLVRSEGNTKASMKGMLLGAGLNTILDPIFIFGFGLGVRGAAIATVISQVASVLYLASLYARKKTVVPLVASEFRIRPKILGQSFLLGTPAFIQSAGMSLLMLLVNTSLGRYGGDSAITTFGMIHRLNMIVIMPVLGIVQGFQPIAGYNYGAQRYDRVKASLKTTILTAVGLATIGYAFMMFFPRLGMGFFTSDGALVASSARVLRIMVMFVPLAAVQITGATYFQAIGKATESMVLGLSRQFFILIPLILLFPPLFGLDGIWMAYPLADLISSAITTSLLIREVRRLGKV